MVEPSRRRGGLDVTMFLGDEKVMQHCRMLDSDAFDIVVGTVFLGRNPQVKLLSRLLLPVPLRLSRRKESGLRYVNRSY